MERSNELDTIVDGLAEKDILIANDTVRDRLYQRVSEVIPKHAFHCIRMIQLRPAVKRDCPLVQMPGDGGRPTLKYGFALMKAAVASPCMREGWDWIRQPS